MMSARPGITTFGRWRASLIADRRGAAALEMVFVVPFLLLGVMVPLADLAIAGFQFISARQALYAFGQSIVYSPPDDLANTSSWTAETAGKAADVDFPISSIQVLCGDGGAACSSTNVASPKYYSFNTTVTLTPIVLTSVLCPDSCTYTISYSARFQ